MASIVAPCIGPPQVTRLSETFLLLAQEPLEPQGEPSAITPTEAPPSTEESTGGVSEAEPVSITEDQPPAVPEEQAKQEEWSYRRGVFALAGGAGYWPNLHDVVPNPNIFNPDAIGRPQTWGFNFELAGHGRLAHWGNWDLFIGADLGFLNNENTKTFQATPGSTETSRLLSQMIYFTPSMKLYYHTRYIRPFIGAGGGAYFLELAARSETGALVEEFVHKTAFGGYVSAGVDIPIRLTQGIGLVLRIEDKFHLVNFGGLGDFSPSSGNLTGPINMIQIGIGLAF